MLENEDLQDYLYRLWQDLVAGLQSALDDPESSLQADLSRMLSGLAEELERDEDMQLWVNGWLQESVAALVDENRLAISGVISDTVRSWDAVETSQRVEAAIGRDLQFIRVNGTLVGGLVGVVIHTFKLFW